MLLASAVNLTWHWSYVLVRSSFVKNLPCYNRIKVFCSTDWGVDTGSMYNQYVCSSHSSWHMCTCYIKAYFIKLYGTCMYLGKCAYLLLSEPLMYPWCTPMVLASAICRLKRLKPSDVSSITQFHLDIKINITDNHHFAFVYLLG